MLSVVLISPVMWSKVVSKNEVENIAAFIEAVKEEVSSWEVVNGIKSEVSLRLAKEKDLSAFNGLDMTSTPDGLDFRLKMFGKSLALAGRDESALAVTRMLEYFFCTFESLKTTDDSVFSSSFRFKRRGGGEFLVLGLKPSVGGRTRMVINVASLKDSLSTKEEFIEMSKLAGDFEVESCTAEAIRLAGDFSTDGIYRVVIALLRAMRHPEVSAFLHIYTVIGLNGQNKREVGEWISVLQDYDFKLPFRWEVSVDLTEGHPPLGHENDGLLALCDKLIYIGTYDEGEGEVHVSLLEKRGGRRHLALDSKYSLLKSQMPLSLRKLEWKRG